ncbi:class I SAM-dependent methyltransferase [Alcaligenes phenolicus]|uniref:Class I SAM-dependent methyltransferase n=1 Tax=Alcaligenes phenolicus TaxID=232846 RepID=A0AAW5VY72_9BURK|nr:class I SAM-dependent methyltransferase [Alcaligenes phenolicus]MCX5565828.1 class I SAM-dependent methyltransferase [Alcaligenes phenolicus]
MELHTALRSKVNLSDLGTKQEHAVNQQHDLSPAEVYERYMSRSIADPWTRVLLDFAAPVLGERALDLACGTGSVARQLAPIVGTSGQVLAVDSNADMLEVGRRQTLPSGASILWEQGNAVRLEIPDDAFDLVLCQQGLQFFPDRLASVREMRRVLRKDGRAVISVWQGLDQHPVYDALFKTTARHLRVPLSNVDVAFSLSDPGELLLLLKNGGFQDVDLYPKTLLIQMPEPERFVQLSVLGAATSVPAFIELDAAQRDALINAVSTETLEVVQQFRVGNVLTLPMSTTIAVAR